MVRSERNIIERLALQRRKLAIAHTAQSQERDRRDRELGREQARLARICEGCNTERKLVAHTKLCGRCFDQQMGGGV